MLLGRELGALERLRKIDIAVEAVHARRDIHRLVRPREVDSQVPWLIARSLAEQAHALGCDPVIAVGLFRQRRREGRRERANLAPLAKVVKVGVGTAGGVQVRSIGIAGIIHAPADRVPLAGTVYSGGKAPLRQQVLSLDAPAWLGLVQIKLAAAHHVITRLPQQRVVSGLLERVVQAVVGHAAAVIFPAPGQAGPRRRAQRRGAVTVHEIDSPGGERLKVRGAHADSGVQARPVGS